MSRAVEAGQKRVISEIKREIEDIRFRAHKRVDELLDEMLLLTE